MSRENRLRDVGGAGRGVGLNPFNFNYLSRVPMFDSQKNGVQKYETTYSDTFSFSTSSSNAHLIDSPRKNNNQDQYLIPFSISNRKHDPNSLNDNFQFEKSQYFNDTPRSLSKSNSLSTSWYKTSQDLDIGDLNTESRFAFSANYDYKKPQIPDYIRRDVVKKSGVSTILQDCYGDYKLVPEVNNNILSLTDSPKSSRRKSLLDFFSK
jgi:hypothetical protein